MRLIGVYSGRVVSTICPTTVKYHRLRPGFVEIAVQWLPNYLPTAGLAVKYGNRTHDLKIRGPIG